MLDEIILIFLKGLIVPLILEILKNRPDRGEEFLLASLRIIIAAIAGCFVAGFISVFVALIFNQELLQQ